MENFYLLTHEECFGPIVDGLFSSKKAIRNYLWDRGDNGKIYYIYSLKCDEWDSTLLVFRGNVNDFFPASCIATGVEY